ncbi:MAG: PAS domain S-box protein [Burkholderiales bacterium]|nr:PAS domain S-box protein [Burkholderiales bacterium]
MDHVLIVEDREEDHNRLKALLQAQGYRITTLVDRRGALATARRDLPERRTVPPTFTSRLARGLEQKFAELEAMNQKLQLNEGRLASLVAMSSDFLWETDAAHRFTYRNSPYRKPSMISGFDNDAHLGRRRWELPHLSPGAAGWAAHRALLDANLPFRDFLISRMGIDGSPRFILLSGDPLFDAAGAFAGYRGIGTDITERKIADEQLRFRAMLLNAVGQALIATDAEGSITYMNRAAERLYGWREDEVLGRKIFDVTVPQVSQAQAQAIMAELAQGREWSGEFPVQRRDATIFPAEIHDTPVLGENGRLIGIIGISSDISERKQTDATLRESSRRLREMSQSLIETEDAIRRRINRELHDRVGASLSAISLNLGILGAGLPPGLRQTLGARLEDTQRMLEEATTHVRDLMAELHPPALDDYGLGAALRAYVHELSRLATVRLSISGDETVPRLPQAVEMALFRVAQGALLNAVTHAQASGIEVLFDGSAEELRLNVSDNGSGFDVARVPVGRPSWGLAIMRERAESVGATLSVDSAPGAGTRVVVTIRRDLR